MMPARSGRNRRRVVALALGESFFCLDSDPWLFSRTMPVLRDQEKL